MTKSIPGFYEIGTEGMIDYHEIDYHEMDNSIVADDTGKWQDSRYHKGVQVRFIVQKGWMAFAKSFKSGVGIQIKILREGEMVSSEPNIPHNIYIPVGAVIDRVKFGDTGAQKASGALDWHASPELDRLTKSLSESQIRELAKYHLG